MAKVAAIVGVLFALAATIVIGQGCSPFGGANAFTCATDQDCSGGFCEPDTLSCSFLDPSCESGRRYGDLSGANANKCVGNETPIDAPVDQPVIPPEAGDRCFGANGLVQPCFAPADVPTGAVTLDTAINTTDSPLCSATVKGTGACVIAGDSITVSASVQITGARPLVLVAITTIQVDAELNAASRISNGAKVGPAANFNLCDPGTPPGTTGVNGGGGAGGSFGAAGGNGGGPMAGVAGAAQATAELRGGCQGQNGKEGSGAAGDGGNGGNSGGVIYLIAEGSITIAGGGGVINASGAGADSGDNQRAGGGGGGSGGLIGLDAPTITNAGQIFANGGSGGEGSGDNGAGKLGVDPVSVAAAVFGIGVSLDGGDGGNGGAGAAGTGANGVQSQDGGGGGGGVGVIRIFNAATIGGVGQISPPPS